MARKSTKRKSSRRKKPKKASKRKTTKKAPAPAQTKRARRPRRARRPTPAKPKTGALENRVDALLRTHGLSLEEAPEDLIAKADRRASRFVPGKPGRRRSKKRSR